MSNKTITFNPLNPSKPFDTISEQILQSPDRLTTIEVNRTTNDGVIRFNMSGLGVDPVRWDSSGFVFNNANDAIPLQFKGTANDNLVFMDAVNDSVGFGTDETTFIFQQVGGGPFTSNPRVMIEIGQDGNDTGFVMRSLSDTPSKAGLVEFMRAGENLTLPLQFHAVGGFRAGAWDGVKFIGGTGLFFALEQDAALDYAPISLDFRAGDGVNPSFTILKGTSLGNVGLRTANASAPITAEGNTVFNFSRVDADFRISGDGVAFHFFVDSGNNQVNIGGAGSGTRARFTSTYTEFNRLNGDKDLRARSVSYNRIFNIDAGGNWAGFGTVFGSEWAKFTVLEAVFNETGIARNFRVESLNNTHQLFVEGSTDFIGLNEASPDVLLDVNGDIAIKNGNELRFKDVGNSNYVGFEAPALTANQIWVLPDADGSADDLLNTDGAGNLSFKKATVEETISFEVYDASPARGSESDIHGGILSLATGQPLDSVPTDIVVTKGTGKLMVVVNAGTDLAGDITVTGDSVDRDTGVITVGDTDTITIDALSTDGSDTDGNGNTRHSFTGAYISSKWFTGTVTLSTVDLTLTDVDVYHVSFEQFNDSPNLVVTTFDINAFTTSVNAEIDAYLYSLEVTGDKCDIARIASLNVGTDGETAIADKYWRLRRGAIAKSLDGTTDGVWVAIFYANNPALVQDMTMKVWATRTQQLTLN